MGAIAGRGATVRIRRHRSKVFLAVLAMDTATPVTGVAVGSEAGTLAEAAVSPRALPRRGAVRPCAGSWSRPRSTRAPWPGWPSASAPGCSPGCGSASPPPRRWPRPAAADDRPCPASTCWPSRCATPTGSSARSSTPAGARSSTHSTARSPAACSGSPTTEALRPTTGRRAPGQQRGGPALRRRRPAPPGGFEDLDEHRVRRAGPAYPSAAALVELARPRPSARSSRSPRR